MLLIVLLALVFANDNKTCDKVYMGEQNGECSGCYGDFLNEKGDDCVVPQTIQEGCVGNKVTSSSCTGYCTDFYYKKDGKCTKGSIEHCVSYDDEKICSYCEEGYAVKYNDNDNDKKENSTCVEAKGGCIQVDANDEKKCILCYGEIKDGECKDDKPSIPNCEVQITDKRTNGETTCKRCKKGYYCKDKCTSCEEVKDKIDNCETYTYKKEDDVVICETCKEGYYHKYSNKTSECIEKDFEHCQTQVYNEKEKTCELCENKYAIKDDKDGKEVYTKCEETKIEYCSRIDNKEHCRQCWSGYSLTKEGKCEKCKDSNAASCSLDLETSYSCKEEEDVNGYSNYALDNKKCKKVNNLASIKKMSASVSMTVMLFVVLFLLF